MTSLIVEPKMTFLDTNGTPLAGGSVTTYIPSTTTLKTTWQDSSQTTANANPTTIDSAGRCVMFGTGDYRFIVKDALGNQIYDQIGSAVYPDSAVSTVIRPVLSAGSLSAAMTALGISTAMQPVLALSSAPLALANLGALAIANGVGAVASVAALRLLTGAQCPVQVVEGYSTVADGGGGVFCYVSTDTTSADNGGTIFVDAASRRWYRIFTDGHLNILWFGGSRSSSNNTPALNSLLAVATTLTAAVPGIEIVFPAGNFIFATGVSWTYPANKLCSLNIRGAGAEVTILQFTTGGLTFNATIPQHTIHLSDMTFAASSVNTSTGVTVNQTIPENLFGQNDFTRLTFRGTDYNTLATYWKYGIDIVGLSNLNFTGCLFYGTPGTGVVPIGNAVRISGYPANGPYPYSIIQNFTDCDFVELAVGIIYGDFVQGMSVVGCNFTNMTNGILQFAGGTGVGAQLAVSASQFNCFGNGIVVAAIMTNISITNSLFFVTQNGTAAIGFVAGSTGSQHTFMGNAFTTFGTPTTTNGISVGGAHQIATVVGNTFNGFTTAVNLTAATNWVVNSNRYNAVTTNVSNTGAGAGTNAVGTAVA